MDYQVVDAGTRGVDLLGPDGSEPILLGQTKAEVADWIEANAPGTLIGVAPGIVMTTRYEATAAEVVAALRA